MESKCGKCHNSYFFDDSQLSDEGFYYKCPKCGEPVFFRGFHSTTGRKAFSVSPLDPDHKTGRNPIVSGTYSGAIGALGCSIPLIMITLLGISFISLGIELSGLTTSGAMLTSTLKLIALGVSIGAFLTLTEVFTGINVWSLPGVLIGASAGGVTGLLVGTAYGLAFRGVLVENTILSSVLSWTIKALLVSVAVILVKKYTFPHYEEGGIQSKLSRSQKVVIFSLLLSVLFPISMGVRELYTTGASTAGAITQIQSEGLTLKDLSNSFRDDGYLVIKGLVKNTSKQDMPGWILIVQLVDHDKNVIGKTVLINGEQLYYHRKPGRGKLSGFRFRTKLSDTVIKPGATVPFRAVFTDTPENYDGYIVTLKDFSMESMGELLVDTLVEMKKKE
ncbi:MAG: hypothetical protein VST72_04290 [Nitrospirota bacterium]|nr:hypothetical protein [Nitrospirota bacterium]